MAAPGPLEDHVSFIINNPDTVRDLLAKLERDDESRKSDEYRTRLRTLAKQYLRSEPEFELLTWVVWKAGLRNRRRPDYDEPALVLGISREPLIDSTVGSGSPYFGEPLDLQIGLLDSDDELVIFNVDRRRFTTDRDSDGFRRRTMLLQRHGVPTRVSDHGPQ